MRPTRQTHRQSILVAGTLAFDDIGTTSTSWKVADRNIKLDTLVRQFGGCAGNLCYTLKKLSADPVPFAQVGALDFSTYRTHFENLQIDLRALRVVPDIACARGLVMTDPDGDQFTAFFPGPAESSHFLADLEVLEIDRFSGAIIAPDIPDKMKQVKQSLSPLPVMWCPGQYSEVLDKDIIRACVNDLFLMVVNRRELSHLTRHIDLQSLRKEIEYLVITAGSDPVEVWHADQMITRDVPAVDHLVDPTGCGDAFSACLFHFLMRNETLDHALTKAMATASACLQTHGAQNHAVSV
jgi:adenosine kinase